MKKGFKIALVIAAVVAVLVLLTALLVSPVAKYYLEKNGKELTGRQLSMEGLCFNLFTGNLEIRGFEMKEADDSSRFVAFDTLSVGVRLFPLLHDEIVVRKIHLTGADLRFWQEGERFNFSDLIERFAADSAATDTPPADSLAEPVWSVGLYDIRLRDCTLAYNDRSVGSDWKMEQLRLDIPGVYFDGKKRTNVGLDLHFADGGQLHTDLDYDARQASYHLHLVLERFALPGLLPYLQQSLRVGSLAGELDSDLTVTGDFNHILDFTLSGTAVLTGLDLRDADGGLVIAADTLSAGCETVNLSQSRFLLDRLHADGLASRFFLEKEGKNNFSGLFIENDATTAANAEPDSAAAPLEFRIKQLSLRNGQFLFADNTLQRPFRYTLQRVALNAGNFDLNGNNDLRMRADLGKSGNTTLRWKGSVNDLSNQNITLLFHNVDLQEFSPYTLEYFGYPLTQGNFSFTSQNIIRNSHLNGNNSVDIFRCEADKRDNSVKPAFRIPMRTALYILKDKNDKINLDLPVSGNLQSPEFSYKKAIQKTIVNLLVKVATAPVSFLSNALGLGNGDQLQSIDIDPQQFDFTSEQYDKLNKLGDLIGAKPDLTLTLQQEINYGEARNSQALFNLKTDYFLRRNPEKSRQTIELVDYEAIRQIPSGDAGLALFADSLLAGAPVAGAVQAKANVLYANQVDAQIERQIQNRDRIVRTYLTEKRGVDPDHLRIETAPIDSMRTYTGKHRILTRIGIAGDDLSELSAPEE